MVMVSIHTITSTTSSCPPHSHVHLKHIAMSTTNFARTVSAREQHRRVTARKHVNSRVKTLSGAKPCVFSGNVAPRVTEVGSLFLRFPASIWESCRQKAHRTAARARFALEDAKKIDGLRLRALLKDEVGKTCTRL